MKKPNEINTRPRTHPSKSGSWMMQGWGAVPLLTADSQFQDLREYLSSARDFVAREQRALLKRVEDTIAANSLEGENKDEYYSFHEDEYDQLHSRFPRIVFSATLLLACSLFESSLVDLCKGFERNPALPTPKSWDDFAKEKGITKAAGFLNANFGIQLSSYSHWSNITNYFKIRDCVVHVDGDVLNMQPKQAAQIRATVKCCSELELDITHGRLVIGNKFVCAVIDDLGGIWPVLHTACFDNEVVGPHYWP
jgi:hypothetical protein